MPPGESCNFIDDDCDTLVDETLGVLGGEVRLPEGTGYSGDPSLAWNGSELAVAYSDSRDGFDRLEIYLTRVSADGVPLRPDVSVSSHDPTYFAAYWPSLAPTGDGFGLSWVDTRGTGGIYGAVLDAAGLATQPDTYVAGSSATTSEAPALVWNGEGYGIAWLECPLTSQCRPSFARFDGALGRISPVVSLAPAPSVATAPSLVWNGSEYGLLWSSNQDSPGTFPQETFFARIGADGTVVQDATSLGPATGRWRTVSLAPMGDGYGALWVHPATDGSSGDGLDFVLLDAAGEPMGPGEPLRRGHDASTPWLAWAGDHFALVWAELAAGSVDNTEVLFQRLEVDGTPVEPVVRVSAGLGASAHPQVVQASEDYAVAWTDSRTRADGEVYFALLGCSAGP
ncbi:MAG: hypothetical protein JXB32_15330 [Deltaproteobacteria bacterium]|nr:hypothetical protein [Deltaproteobacteria bacterium]